MASYSFQGLNQDGTAEQGTIDAGNEKLAFDTLKSRGITVFSLEVGRSEFGQQEPWYKRDIKLFGNRLAFDQQAATAELLATLFGSGIPITEVIRLTALTTENTQVRRHFEKVLQRVEDGGNFADAFETENQIFSPIFVSFLRISDTANTLPDMLRELAVFLRKQNTSQQKILSALIYPAILVVAAFLLLFVVVFYLAPNLAPIFSSVGKEPSGTLAALLGIRAFLASKWHLLLALALIVVAAIPGAFQIPAMRLFMKRLVFQLPFIGNQLKASLLARLCHSTNLLLLSGQTLPDALRISAESMGQSSEFGNQFSEAAKSIETGSTAANIFQQSPILPNNFKELFRIGEETNTLPQTLGALAEAMSAQADQQSQRLLNLMTPMITLVLGLGIGLLIYTLMGAILEVNELAF